MTKTNSATIKAVTIGLLVILIGLLHFLTPTAPHTYHKVHIILRKFYFLPPVMAAVWFGFRGTVLTTAAVSALFTLHAYLDWPGDYMEQANQMGEVAGFWVVGLISGLLFDRQRGLLMELAKANEETLLGLVSALDLREQHTRMHSQRVRDYALLLADKIGVKGKERRDIGFGALLHDVGKIAVPDKILLKYGELTETEWQVMRGHPAAGHQIARRIGFLKKAAEIVHAHHEHFDGTGYPGRLKGYGIPLGARIFMVADVYDALITDRPYHTRMSHDEAVAVIRDKSGSHFDPAVVEAFLKIEKSELLTIEERYREGRNVYD